MSGSELTFFDVDANETILNGPDYITGRIVVFTITGQLSINRHYRINISASNSNGSALSYANISEF